MNGGVNITENEYILMFIEAEEIMKYWTPNEGDKIGILNNLNSYSIYSIKKHHINEKNPTITYTTYNDSKDAEWLTLLWNKDSKAPQNIDQAPDVKKYGWIPRENDIQKIILNFDKNTDPYSTMTDFFNYFKSIDPRILDILNKTSDYTIAWLCFYYKKYFGMQWNFEAKRWEKNK